MLINLNKSAHADKRADMAGAVMSGICVVHCVLLPLALVALGIDGAFVHGPGWLHWLLLVMALPVSFVAFALGIARHQHMAPIIAGTVGFLVMGAGAMLDAGTTATALSVGGGLVVMVAHYRNWLLMRREGAACCDAPDESAIEAAGNGLFSATGRQPDIPGTDGRFTKKGFETGALV